MSNKAFIPKKKLNPIPAGSFSWKAPSNIALIKYWGKHELQLPKNPSLSFTLSNCATKTVLNFKPKENKSSSFDFEVLFDQKPAESFRPKIQLFFEHIADYLPFINDYEFTITTENTFPHSSGIASSASGMAALALCLMQMEAEMNPKISEAYFYQKTGFLARLGSGSAARSIAGPVMTWGKHSAIAESSDEFATANPFQLHSNFKDYQDTILLVDKGQKQVSSSLGHSLMDGHPFAENRFQQANTNLEKLIKILKAGNLTEFVNLVESEALTLHAMMMSSSPYFILIKPPTLEVIQKVWQFRQDNNSHLCFTLDAGANVHLLYPKNESEKVLSFIKTELAKFCTNGEFILDHIGNGSKRLS